MTTRHTAITDAEKHEPKGAADAEDHTVYIADGAGSGSWGKPFKLLDSVSTSSSPTSDTYIELTGLTGYNRAMLVIASLQQPSTNDDLILQLDNSGTYVTSGYTNTMTSNLDGGCRDTDNASNGLMLGVYRDSNRNYMMGVAHLFNLQSAQPCCWFSSFSDSNNFMVSPSSSSNLSLNRGFSRYDGGSLTVTKCRLALQNLTSFTSGEERYVYLYGVR